MLSLVVIQVVRLLGYPIRCDKRLGKGIGLNINLRVEKRVAITFDYNFFSLSNSIPLISNEVVFM